MAKRMINFKRLKLNRLLIPGLLIFSLDAGYANAYENETIDFTWKENPPEEYVTGYRLYYGSDSRYDDYGNVKSDFAYDYFIDVFESVRCSNYDNTCKYLTPDELTCITDNINDPVCTVGYLQGTVYLAMTAYDYNGESGYTHELTVVQTEPLPEEPLPEEPLPEEPLPEEPLPEEPLPEEPLPEEPLPEEPQPETGPTKPKTDNPNKPDKEDNPNKPVKNKN